MTDIDALHSRIGTALERISRGVEALDRPQTAPEAAPEPEAPAADTGEIARLTEALEEERLANAQLEERVRGIRDKQERQVAELREQVAASREALSQLDAELGRLRRANDQLRATNEELTGALAEQIGEPHLVNKAMLAELESIRAARAADLAENAALIAALEPLLTEAEDRRQTEEEGA
ncbi:hypothetical protein ATO8_00370 [Roseivivax marinus]|uniref:Uncharacterized protein n=1 Tax=Roseivivax marinus TaxID=1379903 RepID=W4HNI3_9RHOB|nr:hypothetical protein [Roseivivax marinus]ETW14317.1 hypothetical protein ATO8_00370 [Roseivivax marinus]SEK77138.1 hypothetical protein SAMN05444413_103220 [Roseivivax marinus]